MLADRYIYTLQARDLVRGADPGWVESLYSMAIVPDEVFFLMASSRNLVERTLTANQLLDYWESGMDIGMSRNWFESFIRYQRRLRVEFKKLQEHYRFDIVDANRSVNAIQNGLRAHVETVLHGSRSV